MRKVILFDIDYTLIDTDLLREEFMGSLVKVLQRDTGSNLEAIVNSLINIEMQLITERGKFELGRYLGMIAENYPSLGSLKNDLEKTFSSEEMFTKVVYPETRSVLEKLQGKITVGVFSSGDVSFQRSKLSLSGLDKYMKEDDINIFEHKRNNISALMDKYQEAELIVVDDRAEILEGVKKVRPDALTLWVRRGKFAQKLPETKEYAPSYEIDDLTEIFRVIEV
ncbi:MAG: HAD hydrolase-like protein [Patescibacteria group bacterium]|nr:HAD hydrolase-like protein [Patescibacteria group bacterium]